MIYAMSDLHGCYDKFTGILEQIRFSEADTLYILGDIVDRGRDGIKLLLNLSERSNVVCLRGNHDHTAFQMLKHLNAPLRGPWVELYQLWLSDGGYPTLKAFAALSEQERERVLAYLNSFPIFEELTVAGRSFFLSHTGPEKEKMKQLDLCRISDFLVGEIEYEKIYFEDKIFVSGHTPTGLIERAYRGRIYQKNHHIAVDCGAVFGNPLGCICLDTLETFYAY